MTDIQITAGGILLPFIGTTLGAAMVFMLRSGVGKRTLAILLGFASGVMIAASVWSLLIPAIELSEGTGLPWLPAVTGFILGVLFLLALEALAPCLCRINKKNGAEPSRFRKQTMLVFAVTLHNIPEGMAVGVAFAGLLASNGSVTATGAFALAAGIAIQNLPEGAVISMPLSASGHSRLRSFAVGMLSGIVEPVFACLTLFLTGMILPVLPYILSFAAGAMIFVVISDLIPKAEQSGNKYAATIGAAVGFAVMMLLDVMLG